MSGTDTAAMVPTRYDVVVDGYGYVTARAVDPSLPFRTQQAAISYTPTFLERTNVSGAYGDNQQDFYLTASQHDWSKGEQQRFYRSADVDSVSRCWRLDNVDVRVPGQVTLDYAVPSTPSIGGTQTITGSSSLLFYAADNTNLYQYDGGSGTWVTLGAHGAGTLTGTGLNEIVSDGVLSVYIGGSTSIRRWDGSAFSTFSATAQVGAVAIVNNSLWATDQQHLYYYDTAGTASTAFTWKTPAGATITSVNAPIGLCPFGGKMVVLFPSLFGLGAQIWLADTTGASLVAVFGQNFSPTNMVVVNGMLLISGVLKSLRSGVTFLDPCIMYWLNGNIGELWRAHNPRSQATSLTRSTIAAFDGGAAWVDTTYLIAEGNSGRLMYWDPATGAISCRATIAGVASSGGVVQVASSGSQIMVSDQLVAATTCAGPATVATSGSVTTSLFDFDNSLTKLMRSIKVDFKPASDGDGGSVDVAYQVDGLDGSYTTLASGVTSGAESLFGSTVTGRSISVKVTLNKGTSTNGPTLKRVYVRAAPTLQSYRVNSFILDLSGVSGQSSLRLRDGTQSTLTGETMRANLTASIQATAPFQVTDRTGTYTAVLEPAACEFDQTSPGEWYAQVKIREV